MIKILILMLLFLQVSLPFTIAVADDLMEEGGGFMQDLGNGEYADSKGGIVQLESAGGGEQISDTGEIYQDTGGDAEYSSDKGLMLHMGEGEDEE